MRQPADSTPGKCYAGISKGTWKGLYADGYDLDQMNGIVRAACKAASKWHAWKSVYFYAKILYGGGQDDLSILDKCMWVEGEDF